MASAASRQPNLLDLPESRQWTPRYVAYARWQRRTPDETLAFDRDWWPGGCMAGFITWISARWQEWRRLHGHHPDDVLSVAEEAAFDTWLSVYPPLPAECADGQHSLTEGTCPTCHGLRPTVEEDWDAA